MPNELGTAELSDLPLVYQIRIKGYLRPHWTDWFEGLTIRYMEPGRARGQNCYHNVERNRTMENIQIKLAVLWTCLMLTYLLGDVLRIFSGDFKPGEIMGQRMSQGMWLGVAVVMLIPILMIFLSLILNEPAHRWVHIIVAAFFFLFNVIGLPTYPSLYDKFLIVVGLGFNLITIWYAWSW